MFKIKVLLAVAVISIGVFGTIAYIVHASSRAMLNNEAARIANFNEKNDATTKLALYTEYVNSGRLVGLSDTEVFELLGKPTLERCDCDGSKSMYGWIIDQRAGDRRRDPHATDLYVRYLTVTWNDWGRQSTAEIYEEVKFR